MNNNFITKALQDRLTIIEKNLQRLLLLSQRSEQTGGVERVLFVDLPTAGQKGRIRYCSNCRKSGETAGNGTGRLVIDDEVATVPTWVNVDDLAAAQA